MLQGGSLLLSWPAVPADFGLQSAAEAGGAFAPQPGAFVETNGVRSLLLPATNQHQFFRLKRSP